MLAILEKNKYAETFSMEDDIAALQLYSLVQQRLKQDRSGGTLMAGDCT